MNRKNFRNPLWSKDISDDRLYVDIFSGEFHGFSIEAVQSEVDDLFNNRPIKNNFESEKIRMDGNRLFSEGKYHLALEKYNRSACYAENDSDALALAYSNRSSCYLKLKLFNLCLNDIEMIKRCNYPASLQVKLDSRQAECLQSVSKHNAESVRIDNQKVELSFGEHARYAGAAECLELKHSSEWGRHVTTNRNLEINETVMVESPFSFVGHDCGDSKYYRCAQCYKALMNFIPCRECVGSMFCGSKCLEAANKGRHQFECRLEKVESNDCECKEKEFQLVLDVLWKINSAFETVDKLIRTVESIVLGNSADDCTITDATLKGLQMILQLETNKQMQDASDCERLIRNSLKNYFAAMKMPLFRARFVTEQQIRFLKHMIFHLVHTVRQATLFSDLSVDVTVFRMAELRDYGIGLYPLGSFLNHSCVPNVYCYSVDNRLICKIIRPIKRGEQLFRSYISGQMIIVDDPDDPSIQSSYDFLKTEYKIESCMCTYCVLRKTSSQTLPDPWLETNDPNYLRIRSVLTGEIDEFFRMSNRERQADTNQCTRLGKSWWLKCTYKIIG